jgi:thiamine biosynthesis lipoprotein
MAAAGILRVEQVMGMPIVVDVRDEVGEEPVDDLFTWFRLVDSVFSTYKADSDICRLNRGEIGLDQAHPEVRPVLERCEQLRLETRGYFDATAAAEAGVDPSGLVKGWSVERGVGILERAGAANFAVSAGGDIVVRGGALPEAAWRIGVEHPTRRDAVAAVLELSDTAVATSGVYARGDHVVDPHTSRPPEGVLSVTVVGPDLGAADAYATAAFAMGRTGPHWTARLPQGYDAITILADGTTLSTPGFPSLRAAA